MKTFRLRDIGGYWALIFEFAIELFFVLAGVALILIFGNIWNWKPDESQNITLIGIAILSGIFLLLTIWSFVFYAYRLGPFMKKEGEVVPVTITERSFFGVLYGKAPINGVYVPVKIYACGLGEFFFISHSDGDVIRCFIRKEDLPKPKVVIMYAEG